jgi:hypothetical protein
MAFRKVSNMTDRPNFNWTEMLDDQKSFRVLDLVELTFVGPIWWHSEEMECEGLKGTIFRAYDPDKHSSIPMGHVLVGDVTGDRTEPNVQTDDLTEFDQVAETDVREMMANDGREFLKWMGTVLNSVKLWETPHWVTAYSANDPSAGETVYMDGRRRSRGRNLVTACAIHPSEDRQVQTGYVMSTWMSTRLIDH